jgi:hypothetical protein
MSDNSENLQALDADLAKFAKLIDVAPAVITRRIVMDAHTRISKRTPVDTGRARASWDVKQGQPSDYVPPITIGNVAGKGKTKLGKGAAGNALGTGASSGGKVKDISAAVATIDGTAPVFITTSLDYMQYLEDGSSKQAPAGMVRLSIAEIEIEIESIIEQLE